MLEPTANLESKPASAWDSAIDALAVAAVVVALLPLGWLIVLDHWESALSGASIKAVALVMAAAAGLAWLSPGRRRSWATLVAGGAAQLAYLGSVATEVAWPRTVPALLSALPLVTPVLLGLALGLLWRGGRWRSVGPAAVVVLFLLFLILPLLCFVLERSGWSAEALGLLSLWRGLLSAAAVGLAALVLLHPPWPRVMRQRAVAGTAVLVGLSVVMLGVEPLLVGAPIPRFLHAARMAQAPIVSASASSLTQEQWRNLDALTAAGSRTAAHHIVRLALLDNAGPVLLRRLCAAGERRTPWLLGTAGSAEIWGPAPTSWMSPMDRACAAVASKLPERGAEELQDWLASSESGAGAVAPGQEGRTPQQARAVLSSLGRLTADLWLEAGLVPQALRAFGIAASGPAADPHASQAAIIGLWRRNRLQELGRHGADSHNLAIQDPLLLDLLAQADKPGASGQGGSLALWSRWNGLVRTGLFEPERGGFIQVGQPGFSVPFSPLRQAAGTWQRAVRIRTSHAEGFAWRLPPTPRATTPEGSWPEQLSLRARVARGLYLVFTAADGTSIEYNCSPEESPALALQPGSPCDGRWHTIVVVPLGDWRRRHRPAGSSRTNARVPALRSIVLGGDFAFTSLHAVPRGEP